MGYLIYPQWLHIRCYTGALSRQYPDNIYKRVAIVRFIQAVYGNIEEKQGPVNKVVEIPRKKVILNSFIDVIMNGCFLYKSQWKNIVKEKSHEYDKTRWELTCGLYEGMDIYIKKHAWSIHRYMAMVDI